MTSSGASESVLDKVKFGDGCVVCNEAILKGDITFGDGCIVHPKAEIIAETGPIIFGSTNLIEENVVIKNNHPPVDGKPVSMKIGSNNVFEIASNFYGSTMGDHNVIEVGSHIGKDVGICNNCVVGCKCRLVSAGTLQDGTIIYGQQSNLRVIQEKPLSIQAQMELLKKVLPNFHYLHSKKP